jgi:hypothetical protein
MKTETVNCDVTKLEVTLDELLIALRKLNVRGGQKREEVLRFNQETRKVLQQIHSSLNEQIHSV